jgi:thiol-disulfide isomerase/thioredoxin
MKHLATALGLLLLVVSQAGAESGAVPPQLDTRGLAAYQDYLRGGNHRAFVIAPGGAWAWRGDEDSAERALEAALDECRQATPQRCVPYSTDGKLVFDANGWPTLWGPYLDRKAAESAPTGTRPGQRFPDLAIASPTGKPQKLSDLRGAVVVLHFWGSWCPPCRRELPELQQFSRQLGPKENIHLVLLQAREPIAESRRWAASQKLSLPLYDSTPHGEDFTLANGQSVHDRAIARAFPTTYVLDRHGVVVFAHTGPISGWADYMPFLRDVAAKSGR